jgi:hypothetical protein
MVSTQNGKKKNTNSNPPVLSAKDLEYQKLKAESDFAKICDKWCNLIISAVNKQCFNSIQFIVDKEDELYGSDWQGLVCDEIEVDPKQAKAFWERKPGGGMVTARQALRSKASNTTNAMKKVFLSKCRKSFCQVLLLVTVLTNMFLGKEILDKGGDVPDPNLILGELSYPHGLWPAYENKDNRKPFLRETSSHQHLLFLFTRVMVMSHNFKKYSSTRPLSQYMSVSLEGFLVITYYNSYLAWKDEWHQLRGTRAPALSEDLSDATGDSSKKQYTANARGKGKYKGWTDDGIDLYNQICEVIEKQRSDPDPILANFEKDLMDQFRGGGAKVGESQRQKRKAYHNIPRKKHPEINKENDQNQQNQAKRPRADGVEEE